MPLKIYIEKVKDQTAYKSENYTLTSTPNLTLYRMDYKFIGDDWTPEDIKEAQWQSESRWASSLDIYFFSGNDEEPLTDFIHNLKNYIQSGLGRTALHHLNNPILNWINTVNPNLLNKTYHIVVANKVINDILFKQHKLAKVIDKLSEQYGVFNDLMKGNYTIVNNKD